MIIIMIILIIIIIIISSSSSSGMINISMINSIIGAGCVHQEGPRRGLQGALGLHRGDAGICIYDTYIYIYVYVYVYMYIIIYYDILYYSRLY